MLHSHQTPEGIVKDQEKSNHAQIEGWVVLRYTGLNYATFENDLLKFKNKR